MIRRRVREGKGVLPVIVLKAVGDPDKGKAFQEVTPVDVAHVVDRPAPGSRYIRHQGLGVGVVSAQEHVGSGAGDFRVAHQAGVHGVEALDYPGLRCNLLNPPAGGFGVGEGGYRRRTGLGEGQRVGYVYQNLSIQRVGAGRTKGSLDPAPVRREDDDFRRGGRLGVADDAKALRPGAQPSRRRLRIPAPHQYLVTVPGEGLRQGGSHVSGTQNCYLHLHPPLSSIPSADQIKVAPGARVGQPNV